MIKKTLISLIMLLCLASLNFANLNNISLLASLKTTDSLGGGLRYAITDSIAIDGWLSRTMECSSDPLTKFWADICYKNLGLVFSGDQNSQLNYALSYSVEHLFSQNTHIGAAVTLVELTNKPTSYFSSFDIYLVFDNIL